MSGFQFENDPFADPAIAAATNPSSNTANGLDDFNPFAQQPTQRNVDPFSPVMSPNGQAAVLSPENSFQPGPTTAVPTSTQPSSQAYGTSSTTPGTMTAEQLRQRQEELDRRAAELAAREAELNRAQRASIRENNFPPIPSFIPIKPCFYQDINVDIEIDFQKIVRQVYQLWMAYVGALFANFIGCTIAMVTGIENGAGMFFFALFTMMIFVPLSFIFWFRPLYKAFRDDSSFSFMMFFFVFFCQIALSVVWALGVPGTGALGLFMSLKYLSSSSATVFFRLVCFLVTIILSTWAAGAVIILIKVHGIYHKSSASFEKAQAEFTQKVFSNQQVQQMAANAAQTAARQAMNTAMNQQQPNNGTTSTTPGFRY